MESDSHRYVQIEFTPEFKRNRRVLSKKYPHILLCCAGVQLLHNFVSKNSDIQKGKRAGYRIIYYLKTTSRIILVTIFSKLDQSDISAEQIQRIIREVGL